MNHDPTQAQRQVQDTLILQKVNAAHREAFRTKFPGTVEHAMRLTSERLLACLIKREGCDLGQPQTWQATAEEIKNLTLALNCLHEIHKDL